MLLLLFRPHGPYVIPPTLPTPDISIVVRASPREIVVKTT